MENRKASGKGAFNNAAVAPFRKVYDYLSGKKLNDQAAVLGISPTVSPAVKKALVEGTALNTERGMLRNIFTLLKPYWAQASMKEKAIAYSLLGGTIAATLWGIDIQVEIANWSGQLGDCLQNVAGIIVRHPELAGKPAAIIALPEMQQQSEIFSKLLTNDFAWLVAKFLTAAGSGFVLAQKLSLRWQKWMTENLANQWLDNKAYFRLQHLYKNTENPDQRIHEDTAKFAGGSLSIVTDALGSALTLGTFSTLLWNMSGTFNTASLGLPSFEVPHFMFWAAAAYAGIGTTLTHMIGKPLAKLDYDQQKYNAFFRSELIRVRENAEQIALNNGEQVEKNILKNAFARIYENGQRGIDKRKQLILSNAFYANLASPFPYIVTAPLFFTGQATIGTLSKVSHYFGQVQSSLSWFINNYQVLAEYKATTDRLSGFIHAIDRSNYDREIKKLPPPAAPMPAPAAA
jgi:putative ATP-binding cassette transporter